jgi:16S rRNA (guanine(966)-N(2))-methyltransferase RsmD
MRIISGTNKGRIIHTPQNLPVRPTTDFAKESIFNILNNYFELERLKVLDLFCGTGNISYEFASRGATSITSVDNHYNCCEFVKKTALNFKMGQIKVIKMDVFVFLKKAIESYDVIFADPPYNLENINSIYEMVFSQHILEEKGWLIIEHGITTNLSSLPYFKEKRTYGTVNFSIFSNSNI